MPYINIIMYHYVRKIKGSNFPKIKGLEFDCFKRQLDFLSKKYNFISHENIKKYLSKNEQLPQNACWLTFDDGYKDHIDFVLPELLKRGIKGSFFIPVQPLSEQKILDINAIHHIIASVDDYSKFYMDFERICLDYKINQDFLNMSKLKYEKANRWDNKEIIYIKRMLQLGLPSDIRLKIINELFLNYVKEEPNKFCQKLYMTKSDIKRLLAEGMHIGTHGYSHLRYGQASYIEQEIDIKKSINFLKKNNILSDYLTMCFPYGSYNKHTLKILKMNNFALGLTATPGNAYLESNNTFTLPRNDTNDFPQ